MAGTGGLCTHAVCGPCGDAAGRAASDGDAGAPAQVLRLADRGGARDTWLVLDGAHTRAAAAALAATLRATFPDAALALVVGMAADKDAAGMMAALRAARPMAIAFTQTPIAGSMHRCARERQQQRVVRPSVTRSSCGGRCGALAACGAGAQGVLRCGV
jgi:hypothetical protein